MPSDIKKKQIQDTGPFFSVEEKKSFRKIAD